MLVPQVSYPFVRPGYFITPKVMLQRQQVRPRRRRQHAVRAGRRTSLTRALPTFSLDSGLVFERDSKLFGRAVTQTLEPRLFYVRTPYKDQSQFPNFDSAEAGFNFAQIFTENRFIGPDRIADANQLTAALVSRYIESNGAERLRLALGQRFYFSQQRVQLDPNAKLNQSRSDVLLAASGRVADNWSFDSAIQYNASARSVFSSNYGVQWQAGREKSGQRGIPLPARQLQEHRPVEPVAAVAALVWRGPGQLFAARPQGAREPDRARVQGRLLGVPDGRAALRDGGPDHLDADVSSSSN